MRDLDMMVMEIGVLDGEGIKGKTERERGRGCEAEVEAGGGDVVYVLGRSNVGSRAAVDWVDF